MSNKLYPDIGRVWLPERRLSVPKMAVRIPTTNIVVATVRRPLWSLKGVLALPEVKYPFPDGAAVLRKLLEPFLRDLDPKLLLGEVIYASISHNERVDDGAGHNVNRIFGTVGNSNAVGTYVMVAQGTIPAEDKAHIGLYHATRSDQTYEFTTIGLSRAVGTVQNYVGPTVLNGTYSVDIYKSFSVTGSGTAKGSGLCDHVTAGTQRLLVEDAFADAGVISGDTLNITWTWTH